MILIWSAAKSSAILLSQAVMLTTPDNESGSGQEGKLVSAHWVWLRTLSWFMWG